MFMGKRQVGGNLVVQSFRLLTRYGGTGSIIHGMPGAIGTGIRAATQAITRSASTSPGGTATAATGVVATIGSAMSSFSLASVVSGLAAVGGAIGNRNPESLRFLANVISRMFSSPPPPLVSELSKIASDTAAAAGDTLGAAVAKVPIEPIYPVSGPIKSEVIKAMSPKDIKQYFADNKSLLKIPEGVKDTLLLKAPISEANIKAQQEAFFKTMVFNGLIEGSPAEILAQASEMLGETAASNLLASEANPAIKAQKAVIAAEKAIINAIPEGPRRAEHIAKRASEILEKVAMEEAVALAQIGGPAGESRLGNMMNHYRQIYQGVFGFHPEQLAGELKLTPEEIATELLRVGITTESLASYNAWLPKARTFFETKLNSEQLSAVRQVMTPQLMSQFRPGMLRLFNHNPDVAGTVFYDFAYHIVPYLVTLPNNLRGQILTDLLSNMNRDPGNVRSVLSGLLERIGAQSITLAGATVRTMNNIPARLLFYAIRGGVAATGLFVVTFLGTPNGGGFPQGRLEGVRDRINEWFGVQLWQTPAPDNTWVGQLAAAAGFDGPNAVQDWRAWLTGQARGWLWNFMGAILAGIGLTAGAAATRLVRFFGGTPTIASNGTSVTPVIPPREGPVLTEEDIRHIDPPITSGGSQLLQRKTRRNR